LRALDEPELKALHIEEPLRLGTLRKAKTQAHEANPTQKTACPTCHMVHAGECL
jgi:hypothetical protein